VGHCLKNKKENFWDINTFSPAPFSKF
jgi:hypothetical protein